LINRLISTANSHDFRSYNGLLCTAMIAVLSSLIANLSWVKAIHLSPVVIGILLGMLIGNILHIPHAWAGGIQFAAKRLLRIAIIFYGFRISFQEISQVGTGALIIDSLVVSLTLLFGFFVGKKLLKLDTELSLLISAGAAICGAAAVLAVESVLKTDPYKATIAVGTVVLFGTLSMFLFPLLHHIGFFGFNDHQFSIFAGASIHEVAQVLVAGTNVSEDAGKVAVIVKMIRVLLLVPVLFMLSIWSSTSGQTKNHHRKLIIPWFAVGFILVIIFNSLHILPAFYVDMLNQLDIMLLTMAMVAIGIETKFNKIKAVGMKPFYLAIILLFWLMGSVLFMVKFSY